MKARITAGKGKAKAKAKSVEVDAKLRWSKNCGIRLVNCVAYDFAGFLKSEETATRDVLDAKETKLFWEDMVPHFMDDEYAEHIDKVLYKCDSLLDDAGLSPERTGWRATAALLEEHYKKGLRKPLNACVGRFRVSGNGDGGPVDIEESVTKYSSKFLDFCDGDATLIYMYTVFSRLGLLEFACSDMPTGATHDSSSSSSASVSLMPPLGGSHKEDHILAATLKEVFGASKDDKDVARKRKAEAEVAEHKANGAKIDLYMKQEAVLEKSMADLADLEGKYDDNSESKRKRLTAFIASLQASLAKLL